MTIRPARRFGKVRQGPGIFCAALFLSLAIDNPVVAQITSPLSTRNYEIPSQALSGALARFAQISHVDIIYDERLAENLRSTSVRGTLAPQEALSQLLRGTGLSFRFTRPNAVLIHARRDEAIVPGYKSGGSTPLLVLDTMQVRAAPVIGGRRTGLFDAYGRHVLASIDRHLRPNAIADRRAFRATVRLWVLPDGQVDRADLVTASGNLALDRTILSEISKLHFDAPPADLPQPIRVMLDAR